MANSFTVAMTPPDPLKVALGLPLIGPGTGQVGHLIEAHNWLHAWGGSTNVVSQGWGGNLAAATAVMPGAGTNHCRWRIPQINSAYTSVQVEVWAEHLGGVAGSVRFQSTNGADTETLTINPGAAASYTGTLTVAFGTGYEQIDMTIAGDGASATRVHDMWIRYVPLTSPLAAAAAGSFTPFDAAEWDADSCLASDLGSRMVVNLTEFLARPRVYYQWSDLGSIKSGMASTEHHCWVPVHYDAVNNGLTVTMYVEATGAVGASKVHVYVNGAANGHPGSFYDTYTIDVGAGAARAWYSKTITLADVPRLARMPHPMTDLCIWPGTRSTGGVGDFGPLLDQQNGGTASPTIHSVSVWGV